MKKIMSVFGTRPEAIKMCPLVMELQKTPGIQSIVCLTGQHREMLRQVMQAFDIQADYNLDIMRREQTLTTITADILAGIEPILRQEQPDVVLVHGDTTTSFSVALSSFYQQIPVGHVEAGLRTFDMYSPFPEEINRTLIGHLAKYHFCPTQTNKQNLLSEGIQDHIYVTGNTVIDAFATTIRPDHQFVDEALKNIDFDQGRIITMTAHRRENLGQPLEDICQAALQIVQDFPDVVLIYPVHLNPAVREPVFRILGNHPRIHLIDPIDVLDMHNLLANSCLVLSDSGGLQEEVPHFGIPVLVLRKETERPEAVQAGVVKVVGVDKDEIIRQATALLTDKLAYAQMSSAINPYGDGQASSRIVRALLEDL